MPDSVRWVRWTALGVCAVFLIFYLISDRVTPYTSAARVHAFVVPIVSEVSGYVEAVSVRNNQKVQTNEVLLQIQKQRYALAVERAQSALEIAYQDVGAGAEEIATAEAEVTEARTNLDIYRIQAQRLFSVEETGAIPMAYVDQARAEVAKKEAELIGAQAELQRVRTQLGLSGAKNPQVRSAAADLERGRLDLARTTIRAPSRGMIADLQIDEGYYATAGQPLMTFIAIDEIWIEASMTENNLGRIQIGDPAKVGFDVAPGRVFDAEVVSFGAGAAYSRPDAVGGLPSVEQSQGWLRDPQRFPVILKLTEKDLVDENGLYVGGLQLRVGSQVDVVVYTGDSWILNGLAALWIRVASLFSYAY
jgi:multidrug resistance efflux pump